ncbi:MAG: hypothetical protein G01um101424_73 [Parcubacteria group bacterium Gr01-1014_24]|nr:MAG: hypothetical protein G01um101424_73 [Parcubacteria group bacterium Gr01-1014_24]
MKLILLALCLFAATTAYAQEEPIPLVSGSVWLDLFIGPDGAVVYPQYSFKVDGLRMVVTGYGFWEKAPGEPDFTNHVNTFNLARLPYFSLRTEIGGRVRKFTVDTAAGSVSVPPAGFFQAGPQANLHQVFPLKGMDITW